MVHRASNQSFALVRDESTGLDFWEVWDERMPFGSHRYKIMLVVHDFWFAAGDDGDWIGPYHSREQTCAFNMSIAKLVGLDEITDMRSG